jgi:hypothetical protein
MNCTICGKGTAHGTLLCRPCKAALKRARQLTVQDLPQRPSRARGKGARRHVPVEASTGIDALQRPLRSDHAARLLLGTVAIAALVGAAYVAAREFAGRSAIQHAPPALVAQPASPEPTPVIAAAAAEPMSARLPALASVPELTSSPPVPPNARPGSPTSVITALAHPPAPRSTHETRAPEPARAADAVYPPVDSFGPLAEASKPMPTPPLAAAPPAPPPPDRWQTMSDALTRCASEGGFSGFICDQRVRLASCEGYWGRVAQCPNPPENPR